MNSLNNNQLLLISITDTLKCNTTGVIMRLYSRLLAAPAKNNKKKKENQKRKI
jgi:hypothetical protein